MADAIDVIPKDSPNDDFLTRKIYQAGIKTPIAMFIIHDTSIKIL